MKTRFNSYDIVCGVTELQKLLGMRVNNIYDIDNKTYLIRLQRSEEKSVLLLESGNRFHTTNFEWPKNIAPSGFSMKMRKHLKNKRLESLTQMGSDRIISLQFGTGEAAYHIILELYDRGNIILTDHEMTILNILRPHTEGDKVRFAVREKYPENRARRKSVCTVKELRILLESAKPGDQLKKCLIPHLDYGPALIEHVLLKHGFSNISKIGKTFNIDSDINELLAAIKEAEIIMEKAREKPSKGYIIQKKEERPNTDPNVQKEYFYSNQEFHPLLFAQHESQLYQEFDSFNLAVDEFFSTLEGQKIELRALQQEREAMKKLENIRKDHDQRLTALEKVQEADKQKAELITRNQQLVDNAILAIQSSLANQISWTDIENLVKDATARGDSVAKHIKQLKLQTNHISLYLTDPYVDSGKDNCSNSSDEDTTAIPAAIIDIDLGLTAFANARRYYDQKRNAAKKQQKTIESQGKALKSAEKKTKLALKEVQTITNINKMRKVYWFEKFYWCISSENYLIIAGRDQQQNELIVKRYMKPNDVYVHADIHGASSVIIKNPTGLPVPPKTLNEAGTMAICYSVAWEAKVVTNAYWVLGEQVSKTAPTGEYLTTGSFMIRGKKNFLPPSHLILGLSFLFRLEDGCIERHKGERKVIGNDDALSIVDSEHGRDEIEVELGDDSDENNEEQKDYESRDDAKDEQQGHVKEIKEVEKINENHSDSDDGLPTFPDTQIKIQHSKDATVQIVAEPIITMQQELIDDKIDNVIYLGDSVPIVIKTNQNRRSKNTSQNKTSQNILEQKDNIKVPQQTKRGQKSKLKKIKEKYRDQDEEERKLRMDILQSAGSSKETKKNVKNKEAQNNKIKKTVLKASKASAPKNENTIEAEDDEPSAQADVDMVDALTGQPLPEDELLFAIPVIAPYNTLSNYKFKVKLTPGTGRRGKAARTAVSMFLRDRMITQREKDLLRAVKDEQLARNLPGKVKLSAPRLQVLRK